MIIFRKKLFVKLSLLSIFIVLCTNFAIGQKDSTVVDEDGLKPVRSPWTSSLLIDNQTTEVPNAKEYQFSIHHRFGNMKEIKDLFGIYGASNIRIGINYGITDKISVGFGTEKYKMMQEFQGKYKILDQSRNGKIPVSVTYFGNVVIDARDKEIFGVNYEFLNRLSFFNQVIVSRKFTKDLSVQFAASYSHFNAVNDLVEDSLGNTIGKWKNDYVGLSLGARYKIVKKISAIAEYNHALAINKAWEGQSEPKPSLGLGLEIGTSTHAFQVFAANYDGIIAQENYSHNVNDLTDGGWRFGFNIIVRF